MLLDLQYECLHFLHWSEYVEICAYMKIPPRFDIYFRHSAYPPINYICKRKDKNELALLELITYLTDNVCNSIDKPCGCITHEICYSFSKNYAITNGYLEILKFLHKHTSIIFNSFDIVQSIIHNHSSITEYLYTNSLHGEKTDFYLAYFMSNYYSKAQYESNLFVTSSNEMRDYLYSIIPREYMSIIKQCAVKYLDYEMVEYLFHKGEKFDTHHLFEYNETQDIKMANLLLNTCKVKIDKIPTNIRFLKLNKEYKKLLCKHANFLDILLMQL